ncbi:MAG: NAD-dependent epimerase/dehydratase family protein [Polyangia bacterium]|nr:NAD-dependent epimerase/dehydratase family protein [Polyangia bacterium]
MAVDKGSWATQPGLGGRVVALTGAHGQLGSELIRRLEADRRYYKVVAFDLRKPDFPLEKTQFHKIDLTLPNADGHLAAILRSERVDTLVHLAFLSDFTHRSSWAHELESIGSMHVLNACSESQVGRFVMWSQGMCYGANPNNPAYLREDHPLEAASGPNDTFFADKIDAEHQVRQFAQERPEVTVTVLRMAPVLSAQSSNVISRMLTSRTIPVLLGYDPLMQFLHPSDASSALKQVIDHEHPGVFNIASNGVLPLRTVIGLLGRLPLPVPASVASRLGHFLWMGQVVDVPPSFLSFLRYPCVLDTDKARFELGFEPEHDIHGILAELAGRPVPVNLQEAAPNVGGEWTAP